MVREQGSPEEIADPVPRKARSLRTQQRAYSPVLRAIRVPHATEVTPYWGPTEAGGRTGQRSTLEHHPRCVRPVAIDGPS